MGTINLQIVVGNVGGEPRITQSGDTKIANFSIATSHRGKKKGDGSYDEVTVWHSCVALGGLAEVVANHLKSGQEIAVTGRTQHREYTNKEGQTVRASEVVVTTLDLSGSLNLAVVSGNVGADVAVAKAGETPVANMRIATEHRTKDKETGEVAKHTTWHTGVCFNGLAEIAGQYVRKGGRAAVVGRTQLREYTNKEGQTVRASEVVVSELALLRKRTEKPADADATDAKAAPSSFSEEDSEIPF